MRSVSVGTAWLEPGSPRVLVEMPLAGPGAPDLGAGIERTIRARGFEVARCSGPATLPGGRCPLVDGLGCPLADHADLIVHGLCSEDGGVRRTGEEVLAAHRRTHPRIPVLVVVSEPGGDPGHPSRLVQRVLPTPVTPERVASEVSSILSRPSDL